MFHSQAILWYPGRITLDRVSRKRVAADETVGLSVRLTGTADRQQNARLAKVRGALCCSACRADRADTPSSLRCSSCAADYPVRGGKIYFIDIPDATDELDIVKYRLKKILGKAYYALGITAFVPTFPFNYRAAVLRFTDPEKQLVIDIGAGNHHRIDPRIVTIDPFDYAATDIVRNPSNLPFRDKSVDAFISRYVLEHVPGPTLICSSLARATRKNGLAAHLFMFSFHGSPLFCLIFIPLKFLDFPFVGRRSTLGIAPTIFTVMCKTRSVEAI